MSRHTSGSLFVAIVFTLSVAGVVLAAPGDDRRHAAPATARSPLAVPLLFEAGHSPDGGARYVALGRSYALAADAEGLQLWARAFETWETAFRVGFPGADLRRVEAVGESRARANYLIGAPQAWRTDVPLFDRVRYRQLWRGVDLVLYGNERRLEYDFVIAPGTDPQTIGMRFGPDAQLAIGRDGTLDIRLASGVLSQPPPVAYQLDASGERREVPVEYLTRADGAIGFSLGNYDRSRTLVIDPVVVYSTYLGGVGGEFWIDSSVAGAAIDHAGNLVVSGDTSVASFAGTSPADLRAPPMGRDIFVARLNPTGSALLSLTFLGGNGLDDRSTLAIGSDGSMYVGGRTMSTNLPATPGAPQTAASPNGDGFVCKLNAAGNGILWLTYLGGVGADWVNALALNASDRVVVVGATSSTNFPLAGTPVQATNAGNLDAFATVIDGVAGTLVYSTYFGGSNADLGTGVAIDAAQQVFLAGQTLSPNLPVKSSVQPTLRGGADAFVAGISPALGMTLFSTYLGGSAISQTEGATKLAFGTAGQIYVVGLTDSANFPVASAAQPTFGGNLDGFATRLSWSGSALTIVWSTYLGGMGADVAFGATVDPAGFAYVVGATQSPTFPPNATGTLQGTQDAYLVRIAPAGTTFDYGLYFGGTAIDAGLNVAIDAQLDAYVVGQTTSNNLPTSSWGGGVPFDARANGAEDAFVIRVSTDADGDGLPDSWETGNGLSPTDATGDNGAAGDPDRDGLPNLDEFRSGTKPLESEKFFAEGANGTAVGFSTRFAILNPHADVTFDVTLEFFTIDHRTFTHVVPGVLPGQRVTVDTDAIAGLPDLATAQFSTTIRSRYGIIADRTMTWNSTGYGSHAETAMNRPSTTWYLAEGATHSNFDLFYLLQNPNSSSATVRITYLRPEPAPPLVKTYAVPAQSRFNVWVDLEKFPDDITGTPDLASTDVSAVVEVTNGLPIIVERAMYQTEPNTPLFNAGHESAGVTATNTRWFLAEGATSSDFFDEFILIANPNNNAANVRVTYLLDDGTNIVRQYGGAGSTLPAIAPRSRKTIWVDFEDPRLANAAVSAVVESLNGEGIIVERAMWWPGPTPSSWTEAHNSPGVTQSGTKWGLADGEQGGPRNVDTYILIANTSATAGQAAVTLYFEDDTSVTKTFQLMPNSRTTVGVAFHPEFAKAFTQRFGAIVEALPLTAGGAVPQIVVERAMYSADVGRAFSSGWQPGRPYWPAGTDSVATRIQ